MNKVIKWTVVFGIIFCLAGIGVITAGAMMGGMEEFGNYVQGVVTYGTPHRKQSVEIIQGFEDDGMVPGDDTMMDSISYEHVRKLKIEAGPGELFVVTEDREDPQDTAVRVEGYAVDSVLTYSYDIRQEEDELEIERHHKFQNILGPFKGRTDDYKSSRMETLVIYIPRAYQFREVEIEAAATSVAIDEIRTDKLGLELMAGSLSINSGNVGELDAECKAGSMYLGLEGKKQQFDYELTSNVGTIVLADDQEERYTGLRREKYIDNHAGKSAELECDAGELYIRFTETEN